MGSHPLLRDAMGILSSNNDNAVSIRIYTDKFWIKKRETIKITYRIIFNPGDKVISALLFSASEALRMHKYQYRQQ